MELQLRRMNSGRLSEASGHLHVRVINRMPCNLLSSPKARIGQFMTRYNIRMSSRVPYKYICGHFHTKYPNSAEA